MSQSTLLGTRIAVDNPILDPYRPLNTSVPAALSKIAGLACAAAFATGFVLGAGFDEQAAKAYIEPPIAGAGFDVVATNPFARVHRMAVPSVEA
jgi:hypothetical protein